MSRYCAFGVIVLNGEARDHAMDSMRTGATSSNRARHGKLSGMIENLDTSIPSRFCMGFANTVSAEEALLH